VVGPATPIDFGEHRSEGSSLGLQPLGVVRVVHFVGEGLIDLVEVGSGRLVEGVEEAAGCTEDFVVAHGYVYT